MTLGVSERAGGAVATRRRWSVLRTGYEYIALVLGLSSLALGGIAWSVIALPLYLLLPRRLGTVVGRWIVMALLRLYLLGLRLIGGCRFDVAALDQLRHAGPLIIVPNHPCLLDALIVASRLPNVVCVMKATVLNNPIFGAGARLARYISNNSPVGVVLGAAEELRDGAQVLIFPEGTRTTRLPVNEFVTSAAVIAARAQVPVQTVFIEADSAFLSKHWPLYRRPDLPITYRLRLGKRYERVQDPIQFTRDLEHYFTADLERPHADGSPRVVIAAPRTR